MKMLLPVLFGLLASCSILPESEELRVYQLPHLTHTDVPVPAAPLKDTLRVSRPQASPLIDGTRILVAPEPERLSAYPGVRWSNHAPILLRDRLMEQLRASEAFDAVVSDQMRALAGFELAGELQAFQIEFRQDQPVAVVRMQATLLGGGKRLVLASQKFQGEVAADGRSVEAAVAALGRASDELARQVTAWVIARLRTS